MRQYRKLFVIAASVALVIVLASVFLAASGFFSSTAQGWALTHDVPSGTTLQASDVKPIQVKLTDQFSFDSSPNPPAGKVVSRSLSGGDILRSDDYLPASQYVEVSVAIVNSPILVSGDLVNLYLNDASGTSTLVGQQLQVVAAGNPLTVLVPQSHEADWVALAGKSLVAVKTLGGKTLPVTQQCQAQAIANLEGKPAGSVSCPTTTTTP